MCVCVCVCVCIYIDVTNYESDAISKLSKLSVLKFDHVHYCFRFFLLCQFGTAY